MEPSASPEDEVVTAVSSIEQDTTHNRSLGSDVAPAALTARNVGFWGDAANDAPLEATRNTIDANQQQPQNSKSTSHSNLCLQDGVNPSEGDQNLLRAMAMHGSVHSAQPFASEPHQRRGPNRVAEAPTSQLAGRADQSLSPKGKTAKRLTRDQRRDILLMRRLGHKYEEIARFLGVSQSAVQYTVNTGRASPEHHKAGRKKSTMPVLQRSPTTSRRVRKKVGVSRIPDPRTGDLVQVMESAQPPRDPPADQCSSFDSIPPVSHNRYHNQSFGQQRSAYC